MLRLKLLYVVLALMPLSSAAGWAQFPRSVNDATAVEAGGKIYAAKCASCHGDDTRGTEKGPDMLRSVMVLHDRREVLRGAELGPYLKSSPPHAFSFSEKELMDLSEFLSQSVNKILRSGYDSRPTDLLSGDEKAGEAYFNGAGGCSKCHSPTGDFAGIATRYNPATLQQRFLFPNAVLLPKQRTQVTVTLAGGKSFTGDMVRMDDFTVALREKGGEFRSFNRIPGVKVEVVDPLAAHYTLLGKYTDADIHNLTKYLDTLK